MCFFCELNSINKGLQAEEYQAVENKRVGGPLVNFQDKEDVGLEGVTKNFEIFGEKWGESSDLGAPGDIVSYSFANQNLDNQFGIFDSFITDETFQTEIKNSLSSWENVADIRFTVMPDGPGVDVRFGWRNIDGEGGILGQTTIPSSGPLENVIVAFDRDEDWFLNGDAPSDKIDFSSTAIHEIGHAIGIDHSNSQDALMNARYSETIFDLMQDDIEAAVAIYGTNDVLQIEIYRFYNSAVGGHLFTGDIPEKASVDQNASFDAEGIGFAALSRDAQDINGSIPIHRFHNAKLGSHFFTASELERDHVTTLENYIYEGEGFRAFNVDSASTTPVYRFFNETSGGHFFTASENEKNIVLNLPQLHYEGEAFYAFLV
jgi:hypothetical protein